MLAICLADNQVIRHLVKVLVRFSKPITGFDNWCTSLTYLYTYFYWRVHDFGQALHTLTRTLIVSLPFFKVFKKFSGSSDFILFKNLLLCI